MVTVVDAARRHVDESTLLRGFGRDYFGVHGYACSQAQIHKVKEISACVT